MKVPCRFASLVVEVAVQDHVDAVRAATPRVVGKDFFFCDEIIDDEVKCDRVKCCFPKIHVARRNSEFPLSGGNELKRKRMCGCGGLCVCATVCDRAC